MPEKHTDQVLQKAEHPGSAPLSGKFDDVRTQQLEGPLPGIAAAQHAVDKHFGHVTIDHTQAAAHTHNEHADARIATNTPAKTEKTAESNAPTEIKQAQPEAQTQPTAYQPEMSWAQRLQSDVNQATSMLQRGVANIESGAQAHYANPYGSGWDADWKDIASPSPIDRRVIDAFKAIYDGPHELLQNLDRGLNG